RSGRRPRRRCPSRSPRARRMGATQSLLYFGPELVLTAAIMAVLALDLGLTASGVERSRWPGVVALAGAAAAIASALSLLDVPTRAWLFGRMLVFDGFSVYFKMLLGLALLAAVWMSLGSREVRGQPNEGEYFTLLLSSALAMLLMAAAGNLLMAYRAPDVYTGAPIPVTAFLAVGSKAAGFAMLLRFFHFGVGAAAPAAAVTRVPLVQLGTLLCAATMTLGNLAALSQQNMKRLLAYSSIAHAGYALLGFVVFAEAGVQAVLFYLTVYYIMNLGAFWVVMLIANATGHEDLPSYRGLAWRG